METLAGTFADISIARINEVETYQPYDLIAFFISTYGDGEPCDDGNEMYADIQTVCGKKYTIFGCGNSLYDAYQECAKQVDNILQVNKCERIGEFGMSDECNNRSFEEYENWMFDYVIEISKVFGVVFKHDGFKPMYETCNTLGKKNVPSLRYHEHNPFESSLDIESVEKYEGGRYLKFDVALHKSMKYTTGDHISIIPRNLKVSVDALKKYMQITEGRVSVKPINFGVDNPWKDVSVGSIDEFLSGYVEINNRVSRFCVRNLQEFVEVDDLEKLTSVDISSCYYSIAGLLDKHNIRLQKLLPVSFILQHCGVLQARKYSIASSPSVHADKTTILLRNQTHGVFTNYIADILAETTNNMLPCYISKSKFSPPSPLSTKPILLIGAGSGLAPYLGFLQELTHRMKNRKSLNDGPKVTLLLGVRSNSKFDGLCGNVLRSYSEFGNNFSESGVSINFQLHYAISRPKTTKTEGKTDDVNATTHSGYVQDVLAACADIASQVTPETHIYLCGGAAMGTAVRRKLETLLGNGDARSGDRALKKMASLGRFQQDVW